MRWAADTNIFNYLTQVERPECAVCVKVLTTLRSGGQNVSTFALCAIEFYGFLTRPSLRDDPTLNNAGLGLKVPEAESKLRWVESTFGVWSETTIHYEKWREIVLKYEVRGKNVHDARIAAAAQLHGFTHLLTYNTKDFTRYSDFLIAVHPRDV